MLVRNLERGDREKERMEGGDSTWIIFPDADKIARLPCDIVFTSSRCELRAWNFAEGTPSSRFRYVSWIIKTFGGQNLRAVNVKPNMREENFFDIIKELTDLRVFQQTLGIECFELLYIGILVIRMLCYMWVDNCSWRKEKNMEQSFFDSRLRFFFLEEIEFQEIKNFKISSF